MYYEYQRWYDPSIGRFISQDPLSGVLSDPQSLNPYVYVQNIPTVLTDPSGAAEQGPGCVEGLCEGPAPRVNICAQGGCDPRICADNPFICGEEQWQTDTISVTDPRGPPPGDTVTADPQPLKITVPDTTTPTITEPNPIAISDVSTPSTTESIDNVGHFINTEENGGYKGEFQNHHLLPRQFEDYYQSKELTIDDYTMSLDSNLHRIIHGKGAVYETSWNGQWQFYVDNNPGASQEDITSYMYELMYEFGLL